jgi:hypothetical protein
MIVVLLLYMSLFLLHSFPFFSCNSGYTLTGSAMVCNDGVLSTPQTCVPTAVSSFIQLSNSPYWIGSDLQGNIYVPAYYGTSVTKIQTIPSQVITANW